VVPLDSKRLIEWIEGLSLVKRGAESDIRLGVFLGLKSIFKVRRPKPYMDPQLAMSLIQGRTRKEAKILVAARRAGVDSPRLYAVFPGIGVIVMEYVEGPTLKEYIESSGAEGSLGLVEEAGRQLGLLHRAGIVHGDPTTSNYIVSTGGRLSLIDYGLAEFSESVEDRGVDLHLFRRSIEATHAGESRVLYEAMIRGYESVMGVEARRVAERSEEIRLRGRYVEARRRTVWG